MTSPATPTSDLQAISFWMKTADRMLRDASDTVYRNMGISRHEWRLLTAIADARNTRKPLTAHRLRRLTERGWVTGHAGEWTLTTAGSIAIAQLRPLFDEFQAGVTAAMTDEDLETTKRTLEQIAVSLGWHECSMRPERSERREDRAYRGRPHSGRGHRGGHPRFGDGHGNGHGHSHGNDLRDDLQARPDRSDGHHHDRAHHGWRARTDVPRGCAARDLPERRR